MRGKYAAPQDRRFAPGGACRFAGLRHRTAALRLAARARCARWHAGWETTKKHKDTQRNTKGGAENRAIGRTERAARANDGKQTESKQTAAAARARRARRRDGGLFVESADGGVDFFELGELLFLGVLLFDCGEALGLLEGEGARADEGAAGGGDEVWAGEGVLVV